MVRLHTSDSLCHYLSASDVALILPCDCGALPESIGGGSISYGCVQEEIMFACHPELNCARLIFTPMRGNEAFVLVGAEQFANNRKSAPAAAARVRGNSI